MLERDPSISLIAWLPSSIDRIHPLPNPTIMFFKGYYSITLLAALGLIVALQVQSVYALPLGPAAATTAIESTTRTSYLENPWLATRRLRLLGVEPLSDHKQDNAASQLHLVLLRTPSNAPRNIKDVPRQLLRRASGIAANQTFITAMFVLMIVLSVLLGVGIASISVCGLDWKRYLSRSKPREDLKEKEPADGN
ncbi:hypothetical protein B0I37DRAFT_21324 [Chaetomium sp. MPI-CAGE-AT-0009]|nr:hypothetical protein B0I37DRAFT_21324 [Chaetomium sp. MPI-CAGE-AT-0009]